MSLEDNLHSYDYTLHKHNISSKASRMFRVGFRVLLISSFADFSVAYGASQHKILSSQSAGDITPHTHKIQKKTLRWHKVAMKPLPYISDVTLHI